mmetsp:Transcript_1202/g.1757  ORF Transcript_1202/g.1757 Transcript_1202/m.1757 type:complete len:481 (-) Transcript_1202:1112-2554(-)|eukprot:CAMPEP_0175050070 /NCGR_PEP_ID=MMETSP0052_2-20121109/7068_1 /TAXON_ID=51329 ORGANISM="Polytomella parva, Strain SAG 63-3" /NCGR_SAMPLE_ID=MMETSP0052_2 /ASSEMBLY_ACC=CAM_ASM_000194 /LENGTH=480 /DNA_ID=CAMNT_0016314259 /DNA_START=135 /DNA_END=1577 /DNA_ORIENTATION=+
MKLIFLILFCAFLACVSAVHDLRANHRDIISAAVSNPFEEFRNWLDRHGKSYASPDEFQKRFEIWRSNLEYIVDYNSKTSSHWLHLNSLADLSHEEYKRGRFLGFNFEKFKELRAQRPFRSSGFKYEDVDVETLPPSIDWRQHNAVTEVKNQEQCGSCWSFSATGSVEGINALYTKNLVSLSEQELIDCDISKDQGCNGGLMDYAFEWIISNGGIDTEEDYPYTATQGSCNGNKMNTRVVTIDGYQDVPLNNEIALKKAVANQPVSVAIEADTKSFQLYGGGVYDDLGCGTDLDHGVLVVGYGKDPVGGTYWIVKNSWGAEWGDAGYIKVKMGIKAQQGLCGIAMAASFPIKSSPNPAARPPAPSSKSSPPPPASPSSGPVQCDSSSSCPAQTTCCCLTQFFGQCFVWGCCPMPGATCCEDGKHCCPNTAPVCDTENERCLKAPGVYLASEPWQIKNAATCENPIRSAINSVIYKAYGIN